MPRFNVGLKESNFHEGKLALVKIGDNNLLLGMANGKLYATDSVCSHEGGPPAMLNAMKSLLVKEMNLPQNQIKDEEFYGY